VIESRPSTSAGVDVGEVQARGRLVEDVEGVPGGHFGELGGELIPLRLAPESVVAG